MHYTYIINILRLVHTQLTLHKERIYICKSCFTSFDSRQKKYKLHGQVALDERKLICTVHKAILPVMPGQNTILKFDAYIKTQRHSFVIYVDFEAIWEKCLENKENNHYTMIKQKHIPISYGIYVKALEAIPNKLLEQLNISRTLVIYRGCETEANVADRNISQYP